MTWTDVVDKLLEWERHPEQIADAELIPPSKEAIRRAFILMPRYYRTPDRLVSDGDGGIDVIFETSNGSTTHEIDSAGETENVILRGGKVVSRTKVCE